MNRAMLIVLGTQGLLAALSSAMYCVSKAHFWTFWYLFPEGDGRTSIILPDWLGYWFTFFILYCNLMPISLYAAMEVCNFAQSYFIKSDLGMYDEEQDCPALARSTNLCHELGQVSYVFSDKTGTLTQNIMELKRLSIGDSVFGEARSGSMWDSSPRNTPPRRNLLEGDAEERRMVAVCATGTPRTAGRSGPPPIGDVPPNVNERRWDDPLQHHVETSTGDAVPWFRAAHIGQWSPMEPASVAKVLRKGPKAQLPRTRWVRGDDTRAT